MLLECTLAHLLARPDVAQIGLVCLRHDRQGPNSAAVLRHLHALCQNDAPFADCLCLMGDHARLLLNVLADPLRCGTAWLRKDAGANPGRRPDEQTEAIR